MKLTSHFLFSFLLLTSLVSNACGQTTFFWLNTSGGGYHTAGNWTPAGGPPIFDDFARFGLGTTYGVNFSNAGTQTIDFQVSNGNVTFSYLNPTAQHFWGAASTNYVGPASGDANASATLNLTNMFHLPMRGNHLIVGRAAGKTGTLNINNNGNWESWSGGNFILGQTGAGNLNISTTGILQKSSLTANNISLGASGGTGNATVSGFNASLNATNVMTVGESSNSLGQLTVSNQGKVTVADSLFLGVGSVLDNKITVTGSGSELVLGNDVTSIGFGGGKGTLNVLSGGKVTNSGSSINVGDSVGSLGTLNITGSGSQFLSAGSGAMRIGNSGNGSVNVSDGGNLTVSQINIGSSATGSGSLAIAGNGSLVDVFGIQTNFVGNMGNGNLSLDTGSVLSSNGTLIIGSAGVGTLSVAGGSQLYSADGRVGGGIAGSNAAVSGVGSLWSMTGGLDVGWDKSASLQVEGGGQVLTNGGRLGVAVGGLGTANVTGIGSHWNNAGPGHFDIAQSGQAILNISNGGSMASQTVSIGSQADGQGIVHLSGSGSEWSIGNGVSIGDAGVGTVNVSNGAVLNAVNSAFVRVGHDLGSEGSLTVTGAGSQVLGGTGSSLSIGRSGQGSLNVQLGGTVNVENGTIGQRAGSVGAAIVKNAGSQWVNSETLDVGRSGQGSLLVQNSGSVSAKNLNIGREFGSNGSIILSGWNTLLDVTGNAFIGGSSLGDGGVGSVTINPGTTASFGNLLTLWSQGQVLLNGGTVKLIGINDQSGQFLWNEGTVQFTQNTILNNSLLNSLVGSSHALENGQYLEAAAGKTLIVGNTHFAVDGGQINATNLTNVGTTTVNKGSINLGGQFLNDVQGTFVIQNLGQTSFAGSVINNGSFLMNSSAAKSSGGLFTNAGVISGRGRLQHQLQNNGLVAVNAGDHLINDNGSSMSTNSNHIQLADGRLDVSGILANADGGLITGHGVLGTSSANPGNQGLVNFGTIAVSGGGLDIHGDVQNLAGGRITTSGNSTTTFWDDVEHNGLEIRTASGSSTVFYGSVSGAAPYTGLGSVFFEGDLKPGNSPADVLFEGDLHFGESSRLNIELGGLLAGLEHDRLTVNGNVWLDGFLSVDLIDGFNPVVGNSFTIIRNRGISPQFGQFIGLDQGASLIAGSHRLSVDYFGGGGRDLVLTVVPEPSAIFLASIALAVNTMVQRRKRHSPN